MWTAHYWGILDVDNYYNLERATEDLKAYARKKHLRTLPPTREDIDLGYSGIYIFFDKTCEPINLTLEKTKKGLLMVYGHTKFNTENNSEQKLLKILNETNEKFFDGQLKIHIPE